MPQEINLFGHHQVQVSPHGTSSDVDPSQMKTTVVEEVKKYQEGKMSVASTCVTPFMFWGSVIVAPFICITSHSVYLGT